MDVERNLSVSLNLTPQLVADLGREAGALAIAQAYEIDCADMAVEANRELQNVKQRLKTVEEWRDRFLSPVRQLTETANEFFNPARKSLQAAETHLKTALLDWNRKEQERVAAERRAAEELARRLRAEAEAKAAAERARAEEQAREARQKAAAAEAARARAASEAARLRFEGNAKAAAEAERQARAAAAERARQEEAERSKIDAAEARAQLVLAEAAASAPVTVAEPAKLAGFGARDNWTAELAENTTREQAFEQIVAAIAGVEKCAGRLELLSLGAIDMKAAGKLAKALKTNFRVPGMRAVNRPVAASRAE